MKKRNLFLLLFAIVLVLFTVAFVTVYHLVLKDGEVPTDPPTSAPSEEPTEKDPHELDHPTLLSNMSAASLTAFTLKGNRYVKDENGRFYAESYPDWPLNQDMLLTMATAFTQLSSTYFVENSYGNVVYGFYTDDPPSFTIENSMGDQIDVWIGNECDLDNRYYAASSYQKGVYLLDFDKELLEYYPQHLLVMDATNRYFESDRLQSVVLKDNKNQVVHSSPFPNGEALEGWGFFGHMSVSPSEVASGNPSSAQLTDWGLDPEHALYADIEYLNDADQIARLTCRLGKLNVQEIPTQNGTYKQYKIYVQFDQMVYLLSVSPSEEVASVLFGLQGN